MMVEQWAACAKRGWLRTARARWSVTAGERSSLGTHLISHFGLAARIPLRPLNGQETAGGGGQNGRSAQIHGCWIRCVTAGALLAAAERFSGRSLALQQLLTRGGRAGSPWTDQPAVSCTQPGRQHRLSCDGGAGAGLAAGGVPGDLAGAQIAKEMPSRLVPSSAESLRPPIHLRSELPCRGRVAVVEAGSWEPAAEMLLLSAADGGAAAVHGRHAPAGPPPRCRRSTRRALCPVRWP